MSHGSSPGNVARFRCSECKGTVFLTFKGGAHTLPCPHCGHRIKIEMVHDGKNWRVKDLEQKPPPDSE